MKILLSMFTAGVFILAQTGIAAADTKTYTVSASIPLATSVNIGATRINSADNSRSAVSGTALSFDPMSFNSANQIWLPDHYYSVDVAPGTGAGNVDVTFSYTEGSNPNNPGHGLGWKSTATFMKVAGATETGLSTHGPKKMLKDLSGEHILPSEVSGGFLRVYLGIVSKDPSAPIPDPAASEVFSNADAAGSYDGSLVITATVA